MQINRNSWHARVYRWWYTQKYGQQYDYSRGEMVNREPERSNLCPYMRAVMFWSWMRWLFVGGKVKKVPVPAIVWPTLAIEIPRWAGIVSYDLKMTLWIFECAFIGLVLLLLVGFALEWTHDQWGWFNAFTRAKKQVKEFSGLVGEYSRSAHDRVCPEIEFTNE